nr:MAG TPA: hypothetical protein [Caudoviricetes sp.]
MQFVVFTPLFATLPPTHYIVHCDTMNFFNLLLLFSIYFGAPLRGWGFAFRAWGADIQNRDCLYKNLNPFKYLIAFVQIQTLPNTLYRNPYNL